MLTASYRVLVLTVIIAVLLAGGLWRSAAVQAQEPPLPPRATPNLPTLAPTSATGTITVTPTGTATVPTTPRATPTRRRNAPPERSHGGVLVTGRVTGTVIDQRTGAPAPGIAVLVGAVTVLSDNNGNYARDGLPVDGYVVALVLDPARGTPAQEPVVITIRRAGTTVQHLFFRSTAK